MHRFLRDLHLMVIRLRHAQGEQFWLPIVVIAFALVFLVVGFLRIVEFGGLGIGQRKRRILVFTHIVGCVMAALALILLGLDTTRSHMDILGPLLGVALLLLFPVHIYLGLLRRIHLRKLSGE